MGIVSVFPGMLPASISVAPNSPRARANAKIVPARIPGQASGSDTRRNTRHSDAPKVRAACRSVRSSCSSAARTLKYISGNETTAAAITVAGHEKTTLAPKCSSKRPIGPCRPKSNSKINPTTVGGSTSGRRKIPSSSAGPIPRRLARHTAAAAPAASVIAVAVTLVSRDSQTGERFTPMTVSILRGYAVHRRKPRLFENSERIGRFERVQQRARCFRRFRICQQRHRVQNRLVGILGSNRRNAHRGSDSRVGDVNQPRIRVSCFYIRQRLPHVRGKNQLVLNRRKQAEMLEHFPRVHPRRHNLWISRRDFFHCRLAQILEAGHAFRARWNNQRHLIAQQVASRPRYEQVFLFERVHLLFAGGNEDVYRRALLDLLLQRSRSAEIANHALVRMA